MATNTTGGIVPYSAGLSTGRGTYRGIGAEWFNAENIAYEDFMRQYQLDEVNRVFNAEQAQIQRDFDERLARNSYQYAMEDMKKAGLNPILAYQQGGANTPSGAAASSGSSSFQSTVGRNNMMELLGLVGSVMALLGGSIGVAGKVGKIGF